MEEIKNTPFMAVKKDEENYIIVLGKYQVSEPDAVIRNKKEIQAYLKLNFWDIMLKVMFIVNVEKGNKNE